jgi:hypothetical protein
MVYPNPSAGFIHIKSRYNLDLEMYNATGQRIKTFAVAPEHMDISDQPNGIYFLKFRAGDRVAHKQIYLQKN